MNIYTLDGLRELARSKKKPVCAWTPKNPPLTPPQDDQTEFGFTTQTATQRHTWRKRTTFQRNMLFTHRNH